LPHRTICCTALIAPHKPFHVDSCGFLQSTSKIVESRKLQKTRVLSHCTICCTAHIATHPAAGIALHNLLHRTHCTAQSVGELVKSAKCERIHELTQMTQNGFSHIFWDMKRFFLFFVVLLIMCRNKQTGQNKMTKAQRNELKQLINQRTKWDAASLRVTKTGGITVKFDSDKVTGLTRLERKMRVFIGHYPEILTHI